MRATITILLMLGAFAPSILLAQTKNRISLQTGLFHSFFDGSAIVNNTPTNPTKRIKNYRILTNLLHGTLNDSRGINYERQLNPKSTISIEYMFLDAGYNYSEVFNNSSVKPVISGRNIRFTNINYSRKTNLSSKFDLKYGGGFNYFWGREDLYHYTLLNGWGEPRFYSIYRHDFGLNARIGFEYSPVKWLTLYSNIDYLGILYMSAKENNGNNVNKYYKDKFGLQNIPSRHDISWRFGIGFNF